MSRRRLPERRRTTWFSRPRLCPIASWMRRTSTEASRPAYRVSTSLGRARKTWMAGTSPAMTAGVLSQFMGRGLDKRHVMRYKLRICSPYQDAGRRLRLTERGRFPRAGLVTSALGRLGQDTPGRHHDRTAGAISLDWDGKARVTPASDAWEAGIWSALRQMCCDARVFRTIGARAPNYSQEVAWLGLSGGVRSLPQVPWWNAEASGPSPASGAERWGPRRAVRHGGYGTAPIGVPLSFFLRSFVARMSAAISGSGLSSGTIVPGCRCAHPGYSAA